MLFPEPPPTRRIIKMRMFRWRIRLRHFSLHDLASGIASNIVSSVQWIWKEFWTWKVVGPITGGLYGFGVNAMYGNDFIIAAALYFVATVIIASKIWSQKEVGEHPQRGGIRLVVILLSALVFVASLLWINHRKGFVALSKLQPPHEQIKPIRQPPIVPPISPPVQTPEPSRPEIKKPPHEAPSPQPQEPAAPKVTPNPVGPRIGTGSDAYKDISDDQVGQWAIEEADKIEQMAKQYMTTDPRRIRAEQFFFSAAFKDCCAQEVKDLRAEILRRLGPPAKDPEEETEWKLVFPELFLPPGVPVPPQLSSIDPFPVANYAPYLRRLGLKLKRRGIPRIAPIPLHFSETKIAPERPELPYRIIVTIETKTELAAGYIVVQFNGAWGSLQNDLEGAELTFRPDDIENPELKAQLPKYEGKGIPPYYLENW